VDPLEKIPTTLHGGETLYVAEIIITDFLPSTHTLAYLFAHSTPLTVAAEALGSGLGWSLTVPAANTVQWPSGPIAFAGYATATDTGAKVTAVDRGTIRITASPTYVSWAKTALTAVEAAIAGRADDAQTNFTLGDMAIGFMSLDALIKARQWLKAEVRKDGANRPRRIMLSRFS